MMMIPSTHLIFIMKCHPRALSFIEREREREQTIDGWHDKSKLPSNSENKECCDNSFNRGLEEIEQDPLLRKIH
jgi:hypothetical protein